MSAATLEIYRTESGAVYEVAGTMIRRTGRDGDGPAAEWQEFTAIGRIPASLFTPGETGEILEVVLANGRRIYTSRLLTPFEQN
jgi:hypothetical protein